MTDASYFNVLSLDGGGAKGVYSLGVLSEFESHAGQPLGQYFDLIYGTSTGAIIAACLGLGMRVAEVEKLYFALIPEVMKHSTRGGRSAALRTQAKAVFGDRRFNALQTRIGIVACNYDAERPMIFKTYPEQAYSRTASFEPGFGCTIADAVVASAAAFPFFERVELATMNQGQPVVLDGGFAANNPTLLAIADAHHVLGVSDAQLRILSVGVGHYKEPKKSVLHEVLYKLWPFQIIQKMFVMNTNTLEGLRRALFPEIICIRIDDAYPDAQYSTDLLESDPRKLRKLFVLGRESFGKHEAGVRQHFRPSQPK